MSVLIVGGNECMEKEYRDLCAAYGCQAKVYCKRQTGFQRCFGCPDLCVLFTSTVSHTMVHMACDEAKKKRVPIARSHVSSIAALEGVLKEHFEGRANVRVRKV